MTQRAYSGKVMTVLGLIDPKEMGITLPHEHILMDFRAIYKELTNATGVYLSKQPVSLENLDWVRKHRFSSMDNLFLLDEEEAIREVLDFKKEGGHTIVELSNRNHGRDPLGLARISRVTDINIVMGSGYYTARYMTPDKDRKDVEQLAEEFVYEVTEGVGSTGIRVGVLGELGCSWPLKDFERKVLVAAAKAQIITGAPINVHPGRNDRAPMEILNILDKAGADLTKVVMSHVDRTLLSHELRCEMLETGCFLEYDSVGREGYFDTEIAVDIPNDNYRVNDIIRMVEAGYLDQILISSDICTKDMRLTYGGHGYGHILRYFVPLMKQKGMSENEINKIIIDNPLRATTFL